MDDRDLAQQQVAGLRALADMIEMNPGLAKYFRFTAIEDIKIPIGSAADPRAVLGEFVAAALPRGAKITKRPHDDWFSVWLSWGPVGIDVYASREQVCERVVTGTETVTKTVPDPARLAEVPLVEVTEQVEQVQWVCHPLLAVEKASA